MLTSCQVFIVGGGSLEAIWASVFACSVMLMVMVNKVMRVGVFLGSGAEGSSSVVVVGGKVAVRSTEETTYLR